MSKDTLRTELVNADLNAALRKDMDKWRGTLESQDPKKKDALKRTLLLVGSGAMDVSGHTIEDLQVVEKTIKASKNKEPTAAYLSGHMGRVYMSLPKGEGEQTLDWIRGGSDIVKPRFAATHDGVVEQNGKVKETKLGVVKAFFVGLFQSTHYGMDVAMGGKNKPYKGQPDKTIADDGTSGHMYFNLNQGEHGDSLGIGLEGTAPGKSNHLGVHSLVGSADEFTALEGAKHAVKFDAQDSHCRNTIRAHIEALSDANRASSTSVPVVEVYLAYAEKPWYKKIFSKPPYTKEQFTKAIQGIGIITTADQKMIMTSFGKKQMEAGIVVQNNYNGTTINLNNPKLLGEIRAAKHIPDEIIYYKPRNSLGEFMAQELIYSDIDNKPALRDNPQLSYETSVAIGMMYQAVADNKLPVEEREGIRQTLTLLEPENFKTMCKILDLSMDINKFEISTDHAKLASAIESAKDWQLARLGIKDKAKALDALNTMEHLAHLAAVPTISISSLQESVSANAHSIAHMREKFGERQTQVTEAPAKPSRHHEVGRV
jgi:hypothetical protein